MVSTRGQRGVKAAQIPATDTMLKAPPKRGSRKKAIVEEAPEAEPKAVATKRGRKKTVAIQEPVEEPEVEAKSASTRGRKKIGAKESVEEAPEVETRAASTRGRKKTVVAEAVVEAEASKVATKAPTRGRKKAVINQPVEEEAPEVGEKPAPARGHKKAATEETPAAEPKSTRAKAVSRKRVTTKAAVEPEPEPVAEPEPPKKATRGRKPAAATKEKDVETRPATKPTRGRKRVADEEPEEMREAAKQENEFGAKVAATKTTRGRKRVAIEEPVEPPRKKIVAAAKKTAKKTAPIPIVTNGAAAAKKPDRTTRGRKAVQQPPSEPKPSMLPLLSTVKVPNPLDESEDIEIENSPPLMPSPIKSSTQIQLGHVDEIVKARVSPLKAPPMKPIPQTQSVKQAKDIGMNKASPLKAPPMKPIVQVKPSLGQDTANQISPLRAPPVKHNIHLQSAVMNKDATTNQQSPLKATPFRFSNILSPRKLMGHIQPFGFSLASASKPKDLSIENVEDPFAASVSPLKASPFKPKIASPLKAPAMKPNVASPMKALDNGLVSFSHSPVHQAKIKIRTTYPFAEYPKYPNTPEANPFVEYPDVSKTPAVPAQGRTTPEANQFVEYPSLTKTPLVRPQASPAPETDPFVEYPDLSKTPAALAVSDETAKIASKTDSTSKEFAEFPNYPNTPHIAALSVETTSRVASKTDSPSKEFAEFPNYPNTPAHITIPAAKASSKVASSSHSPSKELAEFPNYPTTPIHITAPPAKATPANETTPAVELAPEVEHVSEVEPAFTVDIISPGHIGETSVWIPVPVLAPVPPNFISPAEYQDVSMEDVESFAHETEDVLERASDNQSFPSLTYPEVPSPIKSALRSPAKQDTKTPKKAVTWVSSPQAEPNSSLLVDDGVLSGTVFYVDVMSNGKDSNHLFTPLLKDMGAQCVPNWTSKTMGITHVLYKDGSPMTLEKVVASNGAVKCVNIGFVIDCDEKKTRLDETPYLISLSHVPGQTPAKLPSNVYMSTLDTNSSVHSSAKSSLNLPYTFTPARTPSKYLDNDSPVETPLQMAIPDSPRTIDSSMLKWAEERAQIMREAEDKENSQSSARNVYSPSFAKAKPLGKTPKTCPVKQRPASSVFVTSVTPFQEKLRAAKRKSEVLEPHYSVKTPIKGFGVINQVNPFASVKRRKFN
ncbi:uncharacterized protein BDR25DRAFT_339466 [Lindgomyces ingoldianus]|uniref:Uncharacterized protein n=1 Tax=Lindgomyces ingoldianus TaxID=673940 RepID=A0ACB6RBP0_9PLEO|nr:uncharacterized protein BDR25DRAFT_339466 [Lindgomyces ingoldianus]KAF2476460.1 hypothetical protein BDR25DRAFT_339466 [Lindgomyces ingoldianus]